jgi:hypothetical protein
MPGHMDGIDCMVSFAIGSIGPFNGSNSDWARLERDIRDGLRVTGHKVRDVNVFHMHAAGVSIGKLGSALARTPGTVPVAKRLVQPGTNGPRVARKAAPNSTKKQAKRKKR